MLTIVGLILATAVGAEIIWAANYIRINAFGGAFRKRTTRDHLNEAEALMRADTWNDHFPRL